MLESRSALAALLAGAGRDAAGGRCSLRIGEATGAHLLQLGVYPRGGAAAAAAVRSVLGAELPSSPVAAASVGAHCVFRIAADQYWVLSPDAALAARLRGAVPADAGSVTCLDGARTRIAIEGPTARALLGRLVPIDLDMGVFPAGRFAQTGIHHVGGLLHHVRPDRYEFFAPRTYAASLFEVVADAALPFGWRIAGDGA